jgi:large subunit ribosomal protein L14
MKLQTIMLFRDNKLMPVDNTGVKLVKCIRVIHKTKKIARIGDLLGVFVKKFKKRKKLLKKVLYYGLIISIKASILRPDGT